MTKEIIITKEKVEHLIKINRKALPLTAIFWKIETYDPNKEKTFFCFSSNKHFANTLTPENFYKPTISIINFDENK